MPQPANLLNKIYVVQQQTKTLLVTVKTSEGAAANLNGAIMKTSGDGISITCADDGQATITLSTIDTDIPKGCYYYDIWTEHPQTSPPIRHPVVKHAEMIVEPAITDFTP